MGVRTRRRGVAAGLTVVVLAACGQSSGAPTTDAPAATDDVTVEVLAAGAEPRQVLQLAPEAGTTGSLEMRMEMDTTVAINGQSAPRVDLPAFVMGMSATIDEVTGDTIRMSYTYDTVELDGTDPGGLERIMASMEGVTGTVTTTRSGAFVDGEIRMPDGLDPTVASSMEQFEQQLASMTVPLPTEPVGPGARWRAGTSIVLNQLEVETTATYELRSLQGGEYELAVDIEQRMVPGTIEEAGATIEVVEGSGTGSGTVIGSLDFPLAFEGRTQMHSSMVAELTGEGGSQRMEQKASMTVEMSPR